MSTVDMNDGWDLGEILAERAQPTAEVEIYLNEIGSYAKAQLIKQHEAISGVKGGDAKKLEAIEKAIAKIDKEIDATKYVVHLTAIPSRMREDIASKAMSEFPMRLDFVGRDDPQNAVARMARESILAWFHQIKSVENPHGQSKSNWSEEEIQKFSDSIPVLAHRAIDEGIADLTNKAEEYSVKSKSLDFS